MKKTEILNIRLKLIPIIKIIYLYNFGKKIEIKEEIRKKSNVVSSYDTLNDIIYINIIIANDFISCNNMEDILCYVLHELGHKYTKLFKVPENFNGTEYIFYEAIAHLWLYFRINALRHNKLKKNFIKLLETHKSSHTDERYRKAAEYALEFIKGVENEERGYFKTSFLSRRYYNRLVRISQTCD